MKNIFEIIFTGLFCCCFFQLNAQHTSRLDFNSNWKFKLSDEPSYSNAATTDKDWSTLNLPHDWSIEGNFSKDHPATAGGGALPGGVGWYRKSFTIPAADQHKIIFVQFDGIYRNSEVWINGQVLGLRPNGYISFQYDLTPYLNHRGQKNIIAVRVNNSSQPNSRWYSGSGIYRNVWLTTVDKNHIANWGTFITTTTANKNDAMVHVETKIVTEQASNKKITLSTIVYNAEGRNVAQQSVIVNSNNDAAVKQTLKILKPQLWSIEKPYLYKAVSRLIVDGKITDSYETKFGVRSFYFDANKGFLLNGSHVKILGVCNHHDLGALGSAINRRALQRQLEILKAMGCNGIRTSHNPPAPELLELCDEMGFIVINEAFDMWAKEKSTFDYHLDWKQWYKRDLQDQVLRDRNHPSVFMWSVGNEIGEQWGDVSKGDTSGRVIARELVSILKALDTTREIITANNDANPSNQLMQSGAFNMVGYNYNHGIWDKFPGTWPGKKLVVTESTSALQTRGYYDAVPFDTIRRWPKRWDIPFSNPNGSYTVSAYDHISAPWGSTHEESVKAFLKNDFVSAMYIWTGFDYLGEPTPYSWPARSSYFGIIDLAGFPKDVYYMYQSKFTGKPVLHLYPHWNWKQGDTLDMVCYYNNADEAELFLNDKSLGMRKKSGDELHVKWRVPYVAGKLKVVSRKNGKTVLIKEVSTAGTAAKIILTADRKMIAADSKDLSFITATIVDKNNVPVPRANNLIKFKINGAAFLAGVDSGDPVSHESFKGNQHTALNGLALAILQSTGIKGQATITASSDGLQSFAITIEIK